MSDPCEHCPVPDLCIRKHALWCEWARDFPRDSTEVRHIVDASRMAAGLEPLRGEPVRQPEYPSARPTAAQRAAALGRELWAWFAAGLPLSGEARRRLAICEACEHFDAGSRQCRLCTCYMDFKARLGTSHCPIEKW